MTAGVLHTLLKRQTSNKVGITAYTRLMREMPQADEVVSVWWPRVKEQADRCIWAGYDQKMAASDAILQHCEEKRIIAENLSFEDII